MLIYAKKKDNIMEKIAVLIKKYEKNFSYGYNWHINIEVEKNYYFFRFLIRLLTRRKNRYGLVNRIIFNPFFRKLMYIGYNKIKYHFPDFVGKQAMSVDILFK